MKPTTPDKATENKPALTAQHIAAACTPSAEQKRKFDKAMQRATFTCPCVKYPLGDGRWIITPLSPQLRTRTEDTVAITGIPSKTLYRLADCGLIRCARINDQLSFFWPTEIEELINKIAEDPIFAQEVNQKADTEF